MMAWLRRSRGVVGVVLFWAVFWAAVGALKSLLVDPAGRFDSLWLGPDIGMFPGFVGGVAFSAVLAIFAGGRPLPELPMATVTVWGGMVGFMLGLLPIAINQPPREFPGWLVAVVVIGSLTLLGAVSAAGSLMLTRRIAIWRTPVRT